MKVWMINYAPLCPWNILSMYQNHACMIARLCLWDLFSTLKVDVTPWRRRYTTSDDGRRGGWGRHKTDVMRDWEWKGRKRGNMIENEASGGFESWMGFAFLARRQDLTWGIHHSISAGRPNFCSWVVCDYRELFLKFGSFLFLCLLFEDFLDWQSHRLFFKMDVKNYTLNWHLWWLQSVTIEMRTGLVCVCTRLWVCVGLRWVTAGVCLCLWVCVCVFTRLNDAEACFTSGLWAVCFKKSFKSLCL